MSPEGTNYPNFGGGPRASTAAARALPLPLLTAKSNGNLTRHPSLSFTSQSSRVGSLDDTPCLPIASRPDQPLNVERPPSQSSLLYCTVFSKTEGFCPVGALVSGYHAHSPTDSEVSGDPSRNGGVFGGTPEIAPRTVTEAPRDGTPLRQETCQESPFSTKNITRFLDGGSPRRGGE